MLNSLPALAAVIIGGAVVFAIVGVTAVSKLRGRGLLPSARAGSPIISVTSTMFAVFAAFLIVGIYQRYAAATDNVRAEASTIATMYRTTDAMPIDERTAMRRVLRQYTEAVINREWVAERHGVPSVEARRNFDDIYRLYGALNPTIASSAVNQEFLSQLSMMAEDRDKRSLASENWLPSLMWVGVILGSVIVLTLSFLVDVEPFWLHVFESSALAVLIGVLILIAVVLNHPFRGEAPISPTAFQHSLQVFKSVDMGN